MKKTFYLLASMLFIFTNLAAQEKSCAAVKTGSYVIKSVESGTTLIKRDGKFQTEINEQLGYEIIFKVDWINECTYELRIHKIIKGDPAAFGDGKNVVTTTITGITGRGYNAKITMTGYDLVLEVFVERQN